MTTADEAIEDIQILPDSRDIDYDLFSTIDAAETWLIEREQEVGWAGAEAIVSFVTGDERRIVRVDSADLADDIHTFWADIEREHYARVQAEYERSSEAARDREAWAREDEMLVDP